ncbi:NlpC/P60 family protein [Microbulbifer thermotolerans]|uniref:C40 family peptidase n=1 Tax=Microbulbifer thermotolerans TaxID=252514 RepID=UPI0026710BFE|nr:NlpC/P60 family protein [Microbulbifer thermotolerans]WKT59100.1 NlpC/P60 family protein [Microbulbifer thermotolerans]
MNTAREAAVAHARSMLGVPWRHQGRQPWAVDCVGLVLLSLRAAGLDLSDERQYGREPWNDQLQEKLRSRFGNPVPESDWQQGDIAVFRAPQREPCHIGLLANYRYGGFTLIHARAEGRRCVVEHALDSRWRRLLVEVYSPWET